MASDGRDDEPERPDWYYQSGREVEEFADNDWQSAFSFGDEFSEFVQVLKDNKDRLPKQVRQLVDSNDTAKLRQLYDKVK